MSDTDLDLIDRTLAGDVAAFGELVDRHAAAVAVVVGEIVPREDQIEDVAQECFIKAYRALKKFRRDARFTTWLLRIARNEAISRYRSHSRRIDTFRTEEPEVFDGHEADQPLPDRLVEAHDLEERLAGHLDALPEHYRLALVLYYYEQQSYEEISDILDLPMNTVKSHLRRAKARLREMLLEDAAAGEWSAER